MKTALLSASVPKISRVGQPSSVPSLLMLHIDSKLICAFEDDDLIYCKIHELWVLALYLHLNISAEDLKLFDQLAQAACGVISDIDDKIQADPMNVAEMPVQVTWTLLLGSTILLRLIRSSIAASLDSERMENCMFAARNGLELMSRRNNRGVAKMTRMLSQLLSSKRVFRAPNGSADTRLRVRTRMSSSSLFDAVTRWREEFDPIPAEEQVSLQRAGGRSSRRETDAHMDVDDEPASGVATRR